MVFQLYYAGSEETKAIKDAAHAAPSLLYDVDVYAWIPHDHIAYRYETLRKLGSGEFSLVLEAFDHKRQKRV